MAFKSGYDAIRESVEESQKRAAATGGSGFNVIGQGPQFGYFGWKVEPNKTSKTMIVRLLSDDVATVGYHGNTLCRDGKKKDVVCRKYLPSGEAECPLCLVTFQRTDRQDKNKKYTAKNRPTESGLLLAVLREEDTSVSPPTYSDYMKDYEFFEPKKNPEDENEEPVKVEMNLPWLGIIKQKPGNFWDTFAGYFVRYKTTVNRDYEVTRRGSGMNDTSYTILPCDPVEELNTHEKVLARYEKALNGKTPDQVIRDHVERMGSQNRYLRWLPQEVLDLVGWKAEENKRSEDGASSDSSDGPEEPESETSVAENTGTQFSSLKDKLQGYKKTQETPAPTH